MQGSYNLKTLAFKDVKLSLSCLTAEQQEELGARRRKQLLESPTVYMQGLWDLNTLAFKDADLENSCLTVEKQEDLRLKEAKISIGGCVYYSQGSNDHSIA